MTPKEKAIELVDKFDIGEQLPYYSIKHALISVDEILQSNNLYNSIKTKFYLEVKHEIENL